MWRIQNTQAKTTAMAHLKKSGGWGRLFVSVNNSPQTTGIASSWLAMFIHSELILWGLVRFPVWHLFMYGVLWWPYPTHSWTKPVMAICFYCHMWQSLKISRIFKMLPCELSINGNIFIKSSISLYLLSKKLLNFSHSIYFQYVKGIFNSSFSKRRN